VSSDCQIVLSCQREHTCFGVYEYEPSAAPSISPAPTESPVTASPVATSTSIISSDFSTGADGFTYSDDLFRGTNNAGYSNGAYESSKGASGDGALEVTVGGIDNLDIHGMSGGWQKTFTLSSAQAGFVTITLTYQLEVSAKYESNEYGEVLSSVDGILFGDGGNDFVSKLSGNSGNNVVGYTTVTLQAGYLGQGDHTLAVGLHNNIKTYNDEKSWLRIDSVDVDVIPSASTSVLSADFSTDADGFTYSDDLFKSTSEPDYADGAYQGSGGYNGDGALEVTLGGVDDDEVLGMSGGWQKTFTISSSEAGDAYIILTYQLEQAANYESDETSEVLCSMDGTLLTGNNGQNFLVKITGDGGGGSAQVV